MSVRSRAAAWLTVVRWTPSRYRIATRMTFHQAEAFLIVASMLGLFVWGGLRYDVVALLALATALLTGVVPADKAFLGFASPVIVIIASVLVLSRAITISGVAE